MYIKQIQNIFTNPWVPRSVSITLLLLMTWWLVRTSNILFINEDIKIHKNSTEFQSFITKNEPDYHNTNLFGDVDASLQTHNAAAPVSNTAPLTLRGILATEDPKQGIAQVEQEHIEEYFVVGDAIFGIATLEEIYIDRIIVSRDGKLETLMLPEEFLNTAHYQNARKRQEMKKVASTYRDVLLSKDGMELIKLFGFKTAWKNGGFAGFIVTALGDPGREMMKTLGIEDGDLVTVVNGKRFSESLEAAQSLTDLKTATSFDVIIERGGAEIPMHFELDTPVDKYADLPDGMTKEDAIRAEILATPTWDEQPGTAEIKRIQRERTTGKREAVEFDH